MPKFPAALVDLLFQGKYKRGTIIRFQMECDDPNREFRNKFGIVLNKDTSEAEALLAITTTNLAPFASGRFDDDIFRIDPGAYGCFDKPTILSLREIRPENIADLKNLCQDGQLTFEGDMTPDDLALIEQKVIHSRLIERKYKKRIL
ncbi:MAG: hypothetical protein WBE13_11490 [Candidatus Acidiferrum sp.]